MSAQHYAALQALYGVTSNDLLRSLPDMAEGLHTQLHELQRAPSASATTSIAPVGMFGFSVPSGRSWTVPFTCITYSERTCSATSWAAGECSGLTTT